HRSTRSGAMKGAVMSLGPRRSLARRVLWVVSLTVLAGCQPPPPHQRGPTNALFREHPEVLWEAGHLGHASTGERLGVDRFYVAALDADGTDELSVSTTFANLAQLEPSPVLVFDVRDGRLANVTEELFPAGPPSAVVNRDMHFADMNGDSHLDFFLCQGTPRFPQLGDIQFPAGDSAHRLAA